LIDEFLAKSNVSRCVDFRETADVIAKVYFLNYLNFLTFICFSFQICFPVNVSLAVTLCNKVPFFVLTDLTV
jgi:hypothetical protein